MLSHRALIPAVVVALSLTACSGGGTDSAGKGESSTASAEGSGGATSEGAGSEGTTASSGRPTSAGSSPAAKSSTPAPAGCAARIVSRLTPQQRVGQLFMVGLQAGAPTSSVTDAIRDRNIGNMLFLGGWEGTSGVAQAADAVRRASTRASTGGLGPLIAADQEGGAVWQLRGAGAPRLPSAVKQGRASSAQRVDYGRQIGELLRKAGVNTNLAPVADTVPPEIGVRNQPIGKHDRQFGSDPAKVAVAVADLIKGLHSGGVATTAKHFPGLGRVTGNTDFTADGIDDDVATTQDPFLGPFQQAVKAGTDLVMVSSARYPKIDPDNQALFSRAIVTDLLRTKLGFSGVVITDDVNAAALSAVPDADRATRFIAAGGDIVLTGNVADAGKMADAVRAKAASDPAFSKLVDAAATRVVALKVSRGLADCG